MPPDKEEARMVRLRENKRRSRQRQRQYTVDLEKKVREYEQRGIQATVEVQAAARLVAQENHHLRALLGQLRVSEQEITRWLKTRAECEERKHSTPLGGLDKCDNRFQGARHDEGPLRSADRASKDVHVSSSETIRLPLGNFAPQEGIQDKGNGSHVVNALPVATHEPQRQDNAPPCKLLSSLTIDSAGEEVDILGTVDDNLAQSPTQDGLPCAAAYQLLRQHVRGEEDVKCLGQVLREGCVTRPNGGCEVKHETIAKALVDICL
ncbi:uncharacterized protein DSM5745_10356 [Aspergillus mulundensis]|uniref:BZIP domain-containing protein n=1 Tax=Aspergillus mulundensis TaxID=1810919 RepID=A0A3D8QN70_9EURO|nr:hypothetical protein DSM5745_10356 [Aspergillus mulundensis]RDW63245.1 hypothetical protein DSM5745_10356 [Aspergillus mulundensis]